MRKCDWIRTHGVPKILYLSYLIGWGILKLQSSNSMANSVPSSFVHKENKLLIAKGEIKQEHKSLFLAGNVASFNIW